MDLRPLPLGDIFVPELRKGIDSILCSVREHLGMEASFVSEFTHGQRVFRNIQTRAGFRFASVGDGDPLEESFCHWVAEGKIPGLMRDAAQNRFAARMPATRELPVGAHLSVPIRLRDGKVYGTFCCFSTKADKSLNERDMAVMRAFADLAGQLIQERIDHDRDRSALRYKVRSIIDRGQIEMVFQPAVRIDRPEVAFVEALARFPGSEPSSPAGWFHAAHVAGLGTELELLAIDSAIAQIDNLAGATALSINVSPDTLLSKGLAERLSNAPAERLILEVTEHSPITDYASVGRALDRFREKGMRLAIDDAGAGYASLRHILNFKPDIIKLDISLSRDIDSDPVRRALAAAMIQFAWSIGAELVAEGVESPAELAALRELGVTIVQGHLCARPSPLSKLAIEPLAA